MKPSRVLLLSIFLTAMILVVVGAVAVNALAKADSAAASPQVDAQATVQAYQQREAEYNALIQQANQQLDKANGELQALQNQVNHLSQATPVQTGLTPDQAGQIARQAAGPGQAPLKTPSLVSFQGKAAYEVVFDKGTIYVDAQTGEVLYNGTVPQKITADQAVQIVTAYLKNTNVLAVDQVTLHDTPLYRVIFKNGTLAWVDMTGQITDIQLPSFMQSGGQASAPANPAPVTVHYDDGPSDN